MSYIIKSDTAYIAKSSIISLFKETAAAATSFASALNYTSTANANAEIAIVGTLYQASSSASSFIAQSLNATYSSSSAAIINGSESTPTEVPADKVPNIGNFK